MTWMKVSVTVCTGILLGCYILYRERKRRTKSTASDVEQKRIEPYREEPRRKKPRREEEDPPHLKEFLYLPPELYYTQPLLVPLLRKLNGDMRAVHKYFHKEVYARVEQADEHRKRKEYKECSQLIADAIAAFDDDENGILIRFLKERCNNVTFRGVVRLLPDKFDKKKLISEDYAELNEDCYKD